MLRSGFFVALHYGDLRCISKSAKFEFSRQIKQDKFLNVEFSFKTSENLNLEQFRVIKFCGFLAQISLSKK